MWTIYKIKERIQIFKETGDPWYIPKNELDKACFQHDMVYREFKDLTRRASCDKILCGKALNLKDDGYQRGLASMVYKFCDKKTFLVE